MTEPIIEAEPVQTQALAVRQEQAVVNPLDLEPAAFRAGLDRRKENRKALIEWVRDALVEGRDFGSVSTKRGPSKPSLWKPGAEKICGMLGVTPTFPTLVEYEQAAIKGIEVKSIVLRCEITNSSGAIIAHGVGGRSLEQDYGDLNKALKMAEKSAHIDATLRMAGLSEIFTQDIEDMPPQVVSIKGDPKPQPPKPVAKPAPKLPTNETRKWMIEKLLALPGQENRKICQEYFQKVGQLMDNEQIEDLPLRFVPFSKQELEALINCLSNFEAGGDAVRAFEPHGEAEEKPIEVPRGTDPEEVDEDASSEPWYNAIVPVPHKGEKRDAYLKNPDTIGSLFEARHEDEDARKRLFGFAHNFEPKGWTKRDGTEMPPNKSDIEFREKLDQFMEWYEENHPEEQK